jgi:hypothetical protein
VAARLTQQLDLLDVFLVEGQLLCDPRHPRPSASINTHTSIEACRPFTSVASHLGGPRGQCEGSTPTQCTGVA